MANGKNHHVRSKFADSPFEGHLEVIATLSEEVAQASLAEQATWAALYSALRSMSEQGISIDELSNASGLTPDHIRKICQRPWGDDVLALFGLR